MNFLDSFSKNTLILNFMKIHPVGDDLFLCGRTDRQAAGWTDMTRLIFVSLNCANALKIKMAYFPVARVCVCVFCIPDVKQSVRLASFTAFDSSQ